MTENKLNDDIDGMAYAGISPDTNEPFYVEKYERHIKVNFNEAVETAKFLNKGFRLPSGKEQFSNKEFRLPSEKEMLMIMQNKTLQSSFTKGKEYLTSDIEGGEVSVVKPEVATPYIRPADKNYGVRFVSDKPLKLQTL